MEEASLGDARPAKASGTGTGSLLPHSIGWSGHKPRFTGWRHRLHLSMAEGHDVMQMRVDGSSCESVTGTGVHVKLSKQADLLGGNQQLLT